MIVPADEKNRKMWAKLCVSLWRSSIKEELLAEWESGGFREENRIICYIMKL